MATQPPFQFDPFEFTDLPPINDRWPSANAFLIGMVANRVFHQAFTFRNWVPPVTPGTGEVELPSSALVQQEIEKVRGLVTDWFSQLGQSPWMSVARNFLEDQFFFFKKRYSCDFQTNEAAEYFNNFWSDVKRIAFGEMEPLDLYSNNFYSDFRLEQQADRTREEITRLACEPLNSTRAFNLGWAVDSVTHPAFPHYARETSTFTVRVENRRSRQHYWHTGRHLPPNLTARIEEPVLLNFLRSAFDIEGFGINCDLYRLVFQTQLPDVRHFGEAITSAWATLANQDLSTVGIGRIEIHQRGNRLHFMVDGQEVFSRPSTNAVAQIINILVEHARSNPGSYLMGQRIKELVFENQGRQLPSNDGRYNVTSYLESSPDFSQYFSLDSRPGQSTEGSGYRIMVNDVATKLTMPSF